MTHPAIISGLATPPTGRARIAYLGSTALCALALIAQPAAVSAQTVIPERGSLDTGVTGSEPTGVLIEDRGSLNVAGGTVVGAAGVAVPLEINNYATATIRADGTVIGDTAILNRGASLTIEAGGLLDADLESTAAIRDIRHFGTIDGNVTFNGRINLFEMDGEITGDATFNSPNNEYDAQGVIGGDLTVNNGTFRTGGTSGGALNVGGDVINNERFYITDGDLLVDGDVTNNSTMIINDGRTLGASTFFQSGRFTLNGSSATIDANMVNDGTRISLDNGVAGDNLVITGNMSGNTILDLDIDLTTANAGFSDTLSVGGTLDGTYRIRFSPILNNGEYTLQDTPITIIETGGLGANLSVSQGALPTQNSLIVYSLGTLGNDVVLRSGVNPEVGAVAGSLGAVQGIIGAIVNRPSGAFASGIAFDAENNCSTGTWARANAGEISTRSNTLSERIPGAPISASLNVTHVGIQGGIDFGCFNAFEGGWDISGGVLFGYNQGNIRSRGTTGDFSQSFLGAYMNAATGDFSAEMQLRQERARFSYVNSDLGLDDSTRTRTTTFSGSASYRFALDDGWAVIPTAGLSIARTGGSSLSFTSPGGTLQLDPHTTKLGFLGLTVGRTMVIDETSALNMFSTLTAYRDFSSDRTSTFTMAGGSGSDTLTNIPLKSYQELSVGLNYINVLNGGGPAGIRQLNANIRADYRFGSDLKSAGVTAQLRLQF